MPDFSFSERAKKIIVAVHKTNFANPESITNPPADTVSEASDDWCVLDITLTNPFSRNTAAHISADDDAIFPSPFFDIITAAIITIIPAIPSGETLSPRKKIPKINGTVIPPVIRNIEYSATAPFLSILKPSRLYESDKKAIANAHSREKGDTEIFIPFRKKKITEVSKPHEALKKSPAETDAPNFFWYILLIEKSTAKRAAAPISKKYFVPFNRNSSFHLIEHNYNTLFTIFISNYQRKISYNHQKEQRSIDMKCIEKENRILCPPAESFGIYAKYIELDGYSPQNEFDSHIHEECEIYVNVSGDVSFMAENTLYPISHGNAVITRPFEYHHCIYNDRNVLHKHFWILFSPNGNEKFLDVFFSRPKGKGNLIVLSEEKSRKLIDVCERLLDENLTDAEKYMNFFTVIALISGENAVSESDIMPSDIKLALKYISENLSENISAADLSNSAHVSVNTLERHFLQVCGMSPSVYIRNRRLANAAKMLKGGASVTEAAYGSGFAGTSHFISLFKKRFGVTPLKYKTQ